MLQIKGKIEGTAVVRDKNGNIKGYLKIGGDASLEDAAKIAGIPPENLAATLAAGDGSANILPSQEN